MLLPQDFQQTLEKEVGIESNASRGIATEINRFVFFPVKESLNQIHTIVPEKPSSFVASVAPPENQTAKVASQSETQKKSRQRKSDSYLEKIDEE